MFFARPLPAGSHRLRVLDRRELQADGDRAGGGRLALGQRIALVTLEPVRKD